MDANDAKAGRVISFFQFLGFIAIITLPLVFKFHVPSITSFHRFIDVTPAIALFGLTGIAKKAVKDSEALKTQSEGIAAAGVAGMREERPDRRVRYINGMQNSLTYTRFAARSISEKLKYPVHFTYNPSHSFGCDLVECAAL